jgi:hypothetical protein
MCEMSQSTLLARQFHVHVLPYKTVHVNHCYSVRNKDQKIWRSSGPKARASAHQLPVTVHQFPKGCLRHTSHSFHVLGGSLIGEFFKTIVES